MRKGIRLGAGALLATLLGIAMLPARTASSQTGDPVPASNTSNDCLEQVHGIDLETATIPDIQAALDEVPMGFIGGGTTPMGLGFLGTAWSERNLLALAYDYERVSQRCELPTAVDPTLLKGVCRG